MVSDSDDPAQHASPSGDGGQKSMWRSAVMERAPDDLGGLYDGAVDLQRGTRIATLGCDFADDLGAALLQRGLAGVNAEPPLPGMSRSLAARYGYRACGVRTGAQHTTRDILQLVRDARAATVRPEDMFERDGRWFDGLRPSVEARGLPRRDDALASRVAHLKAVRRMLVRMNVLIVTLTHTEVCEHTKTGTAYPVHPGDIAGACDPKLYQMRDQTPGDVAGDMRKILKILNRLNPEAKVLLAVSPMAPESTASARHILQAASLSKSVLRVACNLLDADVPNLSYLPALEAITSPAARGAFFDVDSNSVTPAGVAAVAGLLRPAAQGKARTRDGGANQTAAPATTPVAQAAG